MRKIRGIWFMKKVFPIACTELLILAAIVIGAQSYVSFERIMLNASYRFTHHPPTQIWYYWVNALVNTEFIAKVLLLGAFLVAGFIMRDALRVSKRLRGNFLRMQRVT